MAKHKIVVQDINISISTINNNDYISLTDMTNFKDGESKSDIVIQNWMRNKDTIEYIGLWEKIYNPNFNPIEFEGFKKNAGLNRFTLSPKQWIEKTNAIGIISKQGKGGGTFAHKDIAFEFGAWLSPAFQLYLVKEYQRLKAAENNQYNIEWDVKRFLSKANYNIHSDAIKEYIIPKSNYTKDNEWLAYADEADMLNVIIFGCTAKEWREANMDRYLAGENMRDSASIIELIVLSNLESLNSVLIINGASKEDRFKILSKTAKEQKESFMKIDYMKSVKKISDTTYIDMQNKINLLDNKKGK
jgi:hypothetical protein